jgi:two-component system, NarL family, sensor kinase
LKTKAVVVDVVAVVAAVTAEKILMGWRYDESRIASYSLFRHNLHNVTRPLHLARSSVARFGAAGFVAVVLLGFLTLFSVAKVSSQESLKAAEERGRLAGIGIVEPALDASLTLESDGVNVEKRQAALDALDELVNTRVLSDRVVRVKIWSPAGKIMYSDEPKLIGKQFAPKADHVEALADGGIHSEEASTDGPENRFERSSGKLLEVYMPVRTANGEQLIYEQYERFDSLTSNARRLFRRLALPFGAGLALLWLTQLPLAASLTRRVRRAEAERVVLLEQVVSASEQERERIAADLHDGVVQDLAGLTFELEAAASNTSAPTDNPRESFARSAEISRTAMRKLRSSLLDLHPKSVHAMGLAGAIGEAAQRLRRDGVDVDVRVNIDGLDEEMETLVYCTAEELLRNVKKHADASRVTVVSDEPSLSQARVVVTDNGKGFSPEILEVRKRAGHLGIELQQALLFRAGGSLTLESSPGHGTVATIEVPR